MISYESLAAVLQVVMIDLVLCYAIIFAVSVIFIWLPNEQIRKTALFSGLSIAVIKILLASAAGVLLSVVGFMFLMGVAALLMAWVQLRRLAIRSQDRPQISTMRGIIEISLAGVGLSFAPAVGIAGASRDHMPALILGIFLSTAIIVFAGFLLSLLHSRVRWTAWIAAILFLLFALQATYGGINEILGNTLPQFP